MYRGRRIFSQNVWFGRKKFADEGDEGRHVAGCHKKPKLSFQSLSPPPPPPPFSPPSPTSVAIFHNKLARFFGSILTQTNKGFMKTVVINPETQMDSSRSETDQVFQLK